jgi:lipopolysaccharide/colanic/teichoic acid biosynthesis glycosyltransferase
VNPAQLEAESSIDHETIRQPATRQMRQSIGGKGTATAAVLPIDALEISGLPATYEPQHGLVARAAKRTFDVIGAVLLIALLAPAWLMIALLIRADSPGPVLFRQRRIGRDGQPFSMLKFRTMVDGADDRKLALVHLNQAADGLFKIHADPRITRVGQWLRATCLDELPQLLHVVTGRMSLVGPRPLVPEEDAGITGSQRRRLQMRPGMTGVWQVGGASTVPIREMVRLDSDYVDNWSLWTDVKLLASTAGHVVLRKGL